MARASRKSNRRTRLEPQPGTDLLRVGSYNIHRCVGSDGRCDVPRVAEVIRELDCDTIGLQEVDNQRGEDLDQDSMREAMQLEYLAHALGMQGIAGPTLVRQEGEYGNALLTRRPVLNTRRHDLTCPGCEPRGALDVDLEVDGVVVRIIVTHLGLKPAERRMQVQTMLELLRETPAEQPIVVLGDINEWLPVGRPLRWMHGIFGKPPSQRTFPVWLPLFALDRVWVRPPAALLAFNVHRSALARRASDHYPVRAVIAARGVSADFVRMRPNEPATRSHLRA